MNITRLLAALMNGAISVESEKGKGSVFTVKLPQRSAGAGVVGKSRTESLKKLQFMNNAGAAQSQITRTQMPYGKVLVVDDVETNLYVARLLLQPYALKVDEALDAFTAIEMIKAGAKYDVIFMDHMMPKMDGMEAAKALRDLGYREPIVALTANAVSGQADIFLQNGFDGFIAKPIDVREMNAALNKWVRDKHLKQPVPAEAPVNTDALSASDIQLRKIIAKDAGRVLKNLSAAAERGVYDEEGLKTATVNTHGIKGVLPMIGENDLAAAAAELEKAGKAGDAAFVARELPGFIKRLRGVVEGL
jgi:CheY-like chemotaxis protein